MSELGKATAAEPIIVSANQNVLDTMAAAGRLLVVVMGVLPLFLTVLGTHDVVQIIAFLRSNDGVKLVGAVSSLVAIGWGLWKTHKRGAQIATVAADNDVPAKVAKLSK